MGIGNDIIDLAEPGVLTKHEDHRFIARVFTAIERKAIHDSLNPALCLWKIWAAKESAFKIVQRQNPETLFAHRLFEVDIFHNFLTYKNLRFELEWSWNHHYIHCIARSVRDSKPAVLIARLGEIADETLTAEEMKSVQDESSLKVRLLAKELLRSRLGLIEPRIVRPALGDLRFGPPMVFGIDGPLGFIDLSLSHDGMWVAAVALQLVGAQEFER